MNYLDFQLLLYVPQERYEACRAFYEQVFAVQPFYGWDEGCRRWRTSSAAPGPPAP